MYLYRLGIGSETTSETWTEELTAENEAAIKAAEVQRKQAQLLKSLAALEKVCCSVLRCVAVC